MRSAPKASWQDLASDFGLPLPPPKPAPAAPPAPVQPPRAEFQDHKDNDFIVRQAESPRGEELSRPDRTEAEESVLLSPLAADSYKFEVIEETEIEFGSDGSAEEPVSGGDDFRRREEARQEGREEGGQRRRRRRRRRRRGGGDGDRAETRGREGYGPGEGSEERSHMERAPQGYEGDLSDQSAHAEQRTADDEFDEEEARARQEDLQQSQGSGGRGRYGAPRGDRSNRTSRDDRGNRGEREDRPGRRRRGRRGGRRDEPQRSVPDGVAQGDEYDIMDEGGDIPISGDLPYGNGTGYEEDAHDAAVHSAPDHDDEHGDADAEAGEGGESLHRNIHTWEDTVGMLITKNMESRARSPGNPQYSRGGRGRNGRGRGRGRGRGQGGGGGGRSQSN